MDRYLVTGGAGFIGSNFLSLLLKQDNVEVTCMDKFSYAGSVFNLEKLRERPNFTVVKGDITQRKDIGEVWQKPFDYVINFAAESHVDRSIDTPEIFFENNFLGTLNLLNRSLIYPPKLFIQISTDEVYGPIASPHQAHENFPLKPSNPYAASKGSADLAVMSYYKTFNVPAVIVRAVNNFGPYQYPEKFIPKTILCALSDQKIPVFGDGQAIRTWIYVIDFCKAILSVLNYGEIGEVYNIGSSTEITNLELVRIIIKHLGKDERLIDFVTDRPGHDMRYALDSSKARKHLNWNAQYPFEPALQKTIEWYKYNYEHYKNALNQDRSSSL